MAEQYEVCSFWAQWWRGKHPLTVVCCAAVRVGLPLLALQRHSLQPLQGLPFVSVLWAGEVWGFVDLQLSPLRVVQFLPLPVYHRPQTRGYIFFLLLLKKKKKKSLQITLKRQHSIHSYFCFSSFLPSYFLNFILALFPCPHNSQSSLPFCHVLFCSNRSYFPMDKNHIFFFLSAE